MRPPARRSTVQEALDRRVGRPPPPASSLLPPAASHSGRNVFPEAVPLPWSLDGFVSFLICSHMSSPDPLGSWTPGSPSCHLHSGLWTPALSLVSCEVRLPEPPWPPLTRDRRICHEYNLTLKTILSGFGHLLNIFCCFIVPFTCRTLQLTAQSTPSPCWSILSFHVQVVCFRDVSLTPPTRACVSSVPPCFTVSPRCLNAHCVPGSLQHPPHWWAPGSAVSVTLIIFITWKDISLA